MVEAIFTKEEAKLICAIPISIRGSSDILTCMGSYGPLYCEECLL